MYIFYMCMRTAKLEPSVPRRVFTWFLVTHNVCIAIGATGYVFFLLEMLGAKPLVDFILGKGGSFNLLLYGLYFGVLGRDAAELASTGLVRALGKVASSSMRAMHTVLFLLGPQLLYCCYVDAYDHASLVLAASECKESRTLNLLRSMQAATMSFGRKLAVNPRECALCTKTLDDMSHVGGEQPAEATIQLPCKHLFHELCIKGWTMVGKKDTCPTCMEKVDLKKLYSDRPWETRNLQWIGMLDFLRYMVVWYPLIMIGITSMLHLLHLDPPRPPPELLPAPPHVPL
jgi:Ring finger domain